MKLVALGSMLAAMLAMAPIGAAWAHPHGPLPQADIEEQGLWVLRRMVSAGDLDLSWRDADLVYSDKLNDDLRWVVRFENPQDGERPVLCVTLTVIGSFAGADSECAATPGVGTPDTPAP